MVTREHIQNTIADIIKIQNGSYPASYVEAVLDSVENILREYSQLMLYIERMSSREQRIIKSMFNRIYGSKVL